MPSSTPTASSFLRDFRRGLTTPCSEVLKLAALFLLILLGWVIWQSRKFQQQIEAGAVPWQSLEDDFSRSSVMAMRGAARETTKEAKNLVFVGPSSLRCWLPPPDDTSAIASQSAGSPVNVLAMCSNKQSYAFTAALVDRFGADFDGWFVIGAGMHSIGREPNAEDRAYHRHESRVLGFDSEVLRQESARMGEPQEAGIGISAWDHRAFLYQCQLGLGRPSSGKAGYFPYLPSRSIPSDPTAAGMAPFNKGQMEKHLVLLGNLVERLRKTGRARLALVETPWADTFSPSMQTPQWREDETAYQRAMTAWAEANHVPWIDAANHFPATTADFSDPRHLASAGLRQRFLETIARELITR